MFSMYSSVNCRQISCSQSTSKIKEKKNCFLGTWCYTEYTLYTVHTVYTVYTVYTLYTQKMTGLEGYKVRTSVEERHQHQTLTVTVPLLFLNSPCLTTCLTIKTWSVNWSEMNIGRRVECRVYRVEFIGQILQGRVYRVEFIGYRVEFIGYRVQCKLV